MKAIYFAPTLTGSEYALLRNMQMHKIQMHNMAYAFRMHSMVHAFRMHSVTFAFRMHSTAHAFRMHNILDI